MLAGSVRLGCPMRAGLSCRWVDGGCAPTEPPRTREVDTGQLPPDTGRPRAASRPDPRTHNRPTLWPSAGHQRTYEAATDGERAGGLFDGEGDGALATISVTVDPSATALPAGGSVPMTRPGSTDGSLRRWTTTVRPKVVSASVADCSVSPRSVGIGTPAGVDGLGEGDAEGDGGALLGGAVVAAAEVTASLGPLSGGLSLVAW